MQDIIFDAVYTRVRIPGLGYCDIRSIDYHGRTYILWCDLNHLLPATLSQNEMKAVCPDAQSVTVRITQGRAGEYRLVIPPRYINRLWLEAHTRRESLNREAQRCNVVEPEPEPEPARRTQLHSNGFLRCLLPLAAVIGAIGYSGILSGIFLTIVIVLLHTIDYDYTYIWHPKFYVIILAGVFLLLSLMSTFKFGLFDQSQPQPPIYRAYRAPKNW